MTADSGKLFCVCPFALHRQQPEKDKQNVDYAPSLEKFLQMPMGRNQSTRKKFCTNVSVDIINLPAPSTDVMTNCTKNVKFRINKMRTGHQYVGYLYYSETSTGPHKTWAACAPRAAVGHSWFKTFLQNLLMKYIKNVQESVLQKDTSVSRKLFSMKNIAHPSFRAFQRADNEFVHQRPANNVF